MGQILDKALLSVIGSVNRAVFSVSRGRVVLYRIRGRPSVCLMITRSATPVAETAHVGYLSDGADYIVLAAETRTRLFAGLRSITVATDELQGRQILVDVTMITDGTQRAVLLNRLLKRASIDERHDVTRRREIPIARLTPRDIPAARHREAFTGIAHPSPHR